MAGTLALNVEILGQFNKLTTATNGAAGQLQGLGTRVASIGANIGRVLGAIGIGFSLNFLKRELTEAGKAAIEEAKTMEILSIAMQNTGAATQVQVREAEEAIKAMSLQTAVADDQLRPAYQKLFIATNSVTDSNKYLQIALDASAATGKDLDSVTQAMAKSLAGQDTALLKLIPSLRGAEDPLAKLGETFEGAAVAAANLDPYQRMNVAFGEIKESIGVALIPVLNDFADWLVDLVPKVQEFFAELSNPDTELGASFKGLMGIFEQTGEEFQRLMDLLGLSDITFKDVINFIGYMVAAFGQLLFFFRRLAEVIIAFQQGNFIKAIQLQNELAGDLRVFQTQQLLAMQGTAVPNIGQIERASASTITINVNNGNVTAQEIADVLNRAARASGTTLLRAP